MSGFETSLFPGGGTALAVTDTGNVDMVRTDLMYFFDQYRLIHDCIAGETIIKRARELYLPQPNAQDKSLANEARYNTYVHRAVFYGVTERTLDGLVGEVFNVDPTINVPTTLDAVIKDADGSGVPLVQLAQETESDILSYGRAGLFIDYPRTNGEATTKADLESGRIRPTINHFKPWNVINWRTQKIGAEAVLTLVVLRERHEMEVGDFGVTIASQYRVLKLIDGVYWQELWVPTGAGGINLDPTTTTMPLDATGNPLNYIPFVFVGAKRNDHKIDKPPLYAMASINMAHYRNSADYEDAVYMVGQPTPVITGVTQAWVDTVLEGRMELGSRAAIPLPEGGDFKLVGGPENTMVKEAMDQKERQMVALGAKLVEQKTVQRTATEAGIEEASEVSVLATITKNVAAAYKFALEVCALFTGVVTVAGDAATNIKDGIQFDLNTEFALADASPEQISSVIKAWQSEAISFTEMRNKLRKTGVATQDDKTAKAEIQAQALAEVAYNASIGLNPDGTPTNANPENSNTA
jgi:Domain of unknown function (DUF4055)